MCSTCETCPTLYATWNTEPVTNKTIRLLQKTLVTSSLPSMQSSLSCSSAKVLHFRHSAPSSGTGANGCPRSDWVGWGRGWVVPLAWTSDWDCACWCRNNGGARQLMFTYSNKCSCWNFSFYIKSILMTLFWAPVAWLCGCCCSDALPRSNAGIIGTNSGGPSLSVSSLSDTAAPFGPT